MSRSQKGQILLPLLAGCLAMIAFTMLFIRWGNHALWTLRMKLAADAAAISCAREQAEMLNQMAILNDSLNLELKKIWLFGEMHKLDYYKYKATINLMEKVYQVYPLKAWEAGALVARFNGAQLSLPLLKLRHYLRWRPLHLFIRIPKFPFYEYKNQKHAYLARTWYPGKRRAQPSHKAIWMVRRKDSYAVGSSKVWMDVQAPAWLEHNGGFPREKESIWNSVGVQSLYPQFRARLLPRPLYSIAEFLRIMSGQKAFE